MTSMDGMAGGYGLARRGPSLLLRRRSKDLTKGPAKDWSPRLTTEVRAYSPSLPAPFGLAAAAAYTHRSLALYTLDL
jgi:hypothetical protein